MGGNFDFEVDERTNNLNDQSRNDDGGKEIGHHKEAHQPKEYAIADNVDDVGHKSALSLAHLMTCPPIDCAIHANGYDGEYPSEQDDNARKGQTIGGGKLIEITKQQQKCRRYRWKVERMEEPRDYFGSEQRIFVAQGLLFGGHSEKYLAGGTSRKRSQLSAQSGFRDVELFAVF